MVTLMAAPAATAWAGPGGGGGALLADSGTDHYRLAQIEGGWYERKVDLHLAVRGGRVYGDDEGFAGPAMEVTGGLRVFPLCARYVCAGVGLDAGWARHRWTTPVTSDAVESFVALPAVLLAVRPARRWRIDVATGLRVDGDQKSGLLFGLGVVFALDERISR